MGSGRLQAQRAPTDGWLVDPDQALVALGLRFTQVGRPVEHVPDSAEAATPAAVGLSERAKKWARQLSVSEAELARRMASAGR